MFTRKCVTVLALEKGKQLQKLLHLRKLEPDMVVVGSLVNTLREVWESHGYGCTNCRKGQAEENFVAWESCIWVCPQGAHEAGAAEQFQCHAE